MHHDTSHFFTGLQTFFIFLFIHDKLIILKCVLSAHKPSPERYLSAHIIQENDEAGQLYPFSQSARRVDAFAKVTGIRAVAGGEGGRRLKEG